MKKTWALSQRWTGIIFFPTIYIYKMINFQFLISECFCVMYHWGLYTMQEPLYLGKITLVSIWY